MTLLEKFRFLFLFFEKITKASILQETTASGIFLFSKIIGQNLNVYQFNSNFGLTLFPDKSVQPVIYLLKIKSISLMK